jgi:hypothetical protein
LMLMNVCAHYERKHLAVILTGKNKTKVMRFDDVKSPRRRRGTRQSRQQRGKKHNTEMKQTNREDQGSEADVSLPEPTRATGDLFRCFLIVGPQPLRLCCGFFSCAKVDGSLGT